jgi:hypothetical protein
MRTRLSRILGRICAVGVGLSAVLGATELPPELLEPYTVTPCGQPGQVACSITPTGRTPTVADLQGLTNSAFVSFFLPYFGERLGPNPLFGWGPTAANANGYVIGSVSGPDLIHTQFIYHAGKVVCCLTDEPFTLYDINDQNVVVGYDPYLCFLDCNGSQSPPFLEWLAPSGNPFLLTLTFTDPRFDPSAGFAPTYTAIDNQDRILLRTGEGQFLLQPTPEPTSVVLLVTVLVACGILTRWRPRRWRPRHSAVL